MENEIFYLCDPEKNTKCSKRGCHLDARNRRKDGKECWMTKNPEYAKTDGNGEAIILLTKNYTGDGDAYIYEITEMGKNLITLP